MSIELYKTEIEKQASLGSFAAKGVTMAAKGLKSFGGMSTIKRIGAGAAVGAGTGAIKGAVTDKEGNRFGSAVKGALGGAVTGGLAGNVMSNANIAKAGEKVSKLGNNMVSKAIVEQFKAQESGVKKNLRFNNLQQDIGDRLNGLGSKTQNYFGGK